MPIYDGRATTTQKAFSFTSTDFEMLANWPQWKSERELPVDSIVAIGYTWTTYTTGSYLNLSSNLLFVILLALGDDV